MRKPPFDSPEKLSAYVGTYYSDELNADYKISLQGNSLSLQIGESLESPLTASYVDFFTLPGGEVKFSFTRDDKGEITGFVFNSVGDERDVKGITFKRQ